MTGVCRSWCELVPTDVVMAKVELLVLKSS